MHTFEYREQAIIASSVLNPSQNPIVLSEKQVFNRVMAIEVVKKHHVSLSAYKDVE